LQAASVGAQAASVAGRLYLCYQVDLANPKLETPLGAGIIGAHFTGVPVSTVSAFGTNVQKSGSNFNSAFTANTFTIPAPGRWFCQYMVSGSTSTSAGIAMTAGTGGTVVTLVFANSGLANLSGTAISAASAAASNSSFSVAIIDTTTPNVVITCTAPTVVGTACYDLIVLQYPGALALSPSQVDALEQMEIEELRDSVRELKNQFRQLTCLGVSSSSPPIQPLRCAEIESDGELSDDCKTADLEKSVHLERSTVAKLLRAVGAGK